MASGRYTPRRRDIFSAIFLVFLFLVLISFLAGAGTLFFGYRYFSRDLPSIHALKDYQPKTVTYFYSDDGRVIGEFSKERRIVVGLDKIPAHVIQAFIASEDANFYRHSGVDYMGIARAFFKNLMAGRIVQGGSTITQQVTRSFLLSTEKTIKRKAREIILAYRIDRNLTKDEILYLYLNQIYLGHGAHGIEAAAQNYFNVHVGDLTLAQAALIAGLTQAPSRYSPYAHPRRAEIRKKYCLNQMVESGYITREQAQEAKAEPLEFYSRPNVNLTVSPHFTEYVRRMLISKYGPDRLYNDGLRVYTTLNIEMQKTAQEAIAKGLRELTRRHEYHGPERKLTEAEAEVFLDKQTKDFNGRFLVPGQDAEAVVTLVDPFQKILRIRVGPFKGFIGPGELEWASPGIGNIKRIFAPGAVVLVRALEQDEKTGLWSFSLEQRPLAQSALICREVRTGAVKAMVGGTDFTESQFNRAVQSRRQPGSAFKPIIYSAALDNGYTTASIIIDSPIVSTDYLHDRKWKPRNYDNTFHGPTLLYMALAKSRNVVTIKVLDRIGMNPVLDYARKMGITSPLSRDLTLALGSSGVSLLELTTAYTTFPRLGERIDPLFITRIEDRYGRVIEEFRAKTHEAISPQTAYIMLTMLEGVVQRGTATSVRVLNRPVGGKTGTTNDLADAWFIGFTPEYLTGVWVGRDEMERLGDNETGGRAAAPIFIYFMQDMLTDKPVQHFEIPEGIMFASIDVNTGKPASLDADSSLYLAAKDGTIEAGISEAVVPENMYDLVPKDELSEKDL